MGRPNQMHERLDALLDGHTGEVTDDLAPLLEAAESMRAELAQFELDPEVADRHLERVLNSPAPVVPLPVRGRGSGLRRRVAAVALAAALVLVPATMASAASSDALPGQTLYAVKLAVEQVRLAGVQWSASREAAERTRMASRRLQELDKLVQLRIFRQVPPAIRRLDQAVVAANQAVKEAAKEVDGDSSKLIEVVGKLRAVANAQHGELVELKRMVTALHLPNSQAIASAVDASPATRRPVSVPPVVPPAPENPQPELTTPANPPQDPTPSNPPSEPPSPPVTQPPPEPPVTEPSTPPSSNPPTTTVPPQTTAPPTTTAPPAGDDSPGAGKSEMGSAPSSGP
jgi:hypothetical protein